MSFSVWNCAEFQLHCPHNTSEWKTALKAEHGQSVCLSAFTDLESHLKPPPNEIKVTEITIKKMVLAEI